MVEESKQSASGRAGRGGAAQAQAAESLFSFDELMQQSATVSQSNQIDQL